MREGFRVQGSGFRSQESGGKASGGRQPPDELRSRATRRIIRRLTPPARRQARSVPVPGIATCCLLLAACLLVAGCGGPTLETAPISGRITYGGGDWPKPGTIDFTPVKAAEGRKLHPGYGKFDTGGRFTVKTADTKGLVPGTYSGSGRIAGKRTVVRSPGQEKSYVPDKYRNPRTSGLELVIEPGDRSKEFNQDIPKE